MEVGYGQLLAVLSGMHSELTPASVVARLQYLHRKAFPSKGLSAGAGSPADYRADGLMRLVAAFELLHAGVPPGAVVPLIANGWPDVARRFALGWLAPAAQKDAILVFVRVKGIGAKQRDVGELAAGSVDELKRWLQGRGDRRTATVIDTLRVAKALKGAITGAEVGGMDGVVAALDGWAARGGEAA